MAAALSHDQTGIASIELSRKQYKEGGEKAMLEGALQDQLNSFRQGRCDAYSVASYYAILGRKNEAMEYLEKAYERHDYNLIGVRGSRLFRPMYDEPEFQHLLKKLYASEAVPWLREGHSKVYAGLGTSDYFVTAPST